MKTIALVAALAAAFAMLSCGNSSPTSAPAKSEATARTPPAAPAIPDGIQRVAESALGSEAEVLAFGDLSKSGPQQILAGNRLKTAPGTAEGTLITRAVIIQNEGTLWKQIFLCDEHLKNTKGFLGGAPPEPVNGWRLQYEQHEKGLEMYFTPLPSSKGDSDHVLPVGIRWNPKLKRYQSLDRTFENFLGELRSLETPESQVRL